MRRCLIAGNWKMNLTLVEARTLIRELITAGAPAGVDVVVFPSFVALREAVQTAQGSHVSIGAQNCHFAKSGAYTGEISVPMLADVGATMVILGHSERRQLFGERDALVLEKARAAIGLGLTPLICVGESLEERDSGKTFQRIEEQLALGVLPLGAEALSHSVVAYEPIWAIGTGRNATAAQAQEVHAFIRKRLAQEFPESAQGLRILYGGSVKPENAKALAENIDVDGFLVGGASLSGGSFLGILKAVIDAKGKS